MSDTPSRVTRSSSRQPERVASSGRSSSRTGGTAASPARSDSNKKPVRTASRKKSVTREESPAPPARRTSSRSAASSEKEASESPQPVARRKSSNAGSAKKSTSSASQAAAAPSSSASFSLDDATSSSTSAGYTRTDNGASVANELVRRTSSTTTRADSRLNKPINGGAEVKDGNAAGVVAAENERAPLVALLPHMAVYMALVSLVHFLVVYEFSRGTTQASMVKDLASFTGANSLGSWLSLSDKRDVAFLLVVPIYLLAGFLLRWGVGLVCGASAASSLFAANLARMISGGVFAATLCFLNEYGVCHSYESINALFVLLFASTLQDFLLNFPQFTSSRNVYSLATLLVTGYLGFESWALEKVIETPTALPVPPVMIALAASLLLAKSADALGATAGVFEQIGCTFMAVVCDAFQRIVFFAVVPIFSVALFSKNEAIFGASAASTTTSFLESSAASFILVGLVFLLIVNSYQVSAPQGEKVKRV